MTDQCGGVFQKVVNNGSLVCVCEESIYEQYMEVGHQEVRHELAYVQRVTFALRLRVEK